MDQPKRRLNPGNIALLLLAAVALPVTFALPQIDLATSMAVGIVAWTDTGDILGIVAVSLVLIGLLASSSAVPRRLRWRNVVVAFLVLSVFQGGAALLNEHVLKDWLAQPRPNIMWLVEHDALGMSIDQFYSQNRDARRATLQSALEDASFDTIAMQASVRNHWIHEVGYSLPSGHALAALLCASYFLLMARRLDSLGRRILLFALPVWSMGIAWSRVLLRVHRPIDVLVGGILGLVLGMAAAWVAAHWPTQREDGAVQKIHST